MVAKQLASEEVAARVRQALPGVAASLRHEIAQALSVGSAAKPATAPEAVLTVPSLSFRPLADDARLEPIATVDALCELASAAIAGPSDGVALERIVDGIGRLYAAEPERRALLGPPLLQLADHYIKDRWSMKVWSGQSPVMDVCALVAVWLSGRTPPTAIERAPAVQTMWVSQQRKSTAAALAEGRGLHEHSRTLLFTFSQRVHAVACNVALGRPAAPLSTPTHVGGWLSPVTLAERVMGATERIVAIDLAQALLRLVPAPHDEGERERALELVPRRPGKGPAGCAMRWVASEPKRARAIGCCSRRRRRRAIRLGCAGR